ncbi:MAG: cation:proton antiporter subunit C [Deltaproteobacteria bacterium]|nr:cation:proton antiporter subunit C [Deltaproteobacteria bacterium]
MAFLGLWNYWVVIVLMMIGLYIVIARDNFIKKLMGLNLFQVSVIMFYVSMGKVNGGTAPILPESDMVEEVAAHNQPVTAGHLSDTRAFAHHHEAHHGGHEVVAEGHEGIVYSNNLTHVLMLTAIVVGVATTAAGLALVARIHEGYGTAEEDEIYKIDLTGAL